MREDYIHFYVRKFLRESGWTLIAGQYPNGSDDELPSLNVMDPMLARDQSPDHRRHSKNKLVPDLVAALDSSVLVIEMKPRYDAGDEEKLLELLGPRRADFTAALTRLVTKRGVKLPHEASKMSYFPCLAFSAPKTYVRKPGFTYLYVNELGVALDKNGLFA